MSRFLRYPPGCAGSRLRAIHRENPVTLSPRLSLVPNLPGGSAHTTPFCSLGRGSGALKACPERAGTRGRRGPHPPAAPSPGSPIPQEPGSYRRILLARGSVSLPRPYLVPGAGAAAPGAAAAAAAGPRRGCPSAGSARSERVSPLLRCPVGSPFSLSLCRC